MEDPHLHAEVDVGVLVVARLGLVVELGADQLQLAGAGFNTVVIDLLFDFQTYPKSQNCCRLALNINRIVIDLLLKIQLQQR